MLSQCCTQHGMVSSSRMRSSQLARHSFRQPCHHAARAPSVNTRRQLGWAAVDVGVSASTQASAQASSSGTGVVFSIDDTAGASHALQWGIDNVLQPGEKVHLVHVVLDTRVPVTSVATTGTGRMSYDSLDLSVRRSPEHQEHQRRLEERAEQVVQERARKLLSQAGISDYEVSLPVEPGARSAATIGGAICRAAEGSRLLVVANHGPGVLAEFGSVARYAYQHSPVPLALVPSGQDATKAAVMLVVQCGDELNACLHFAEHGLLRKGDTLHILRAGDDAANPAVVAPSIIQGLHSQGIMDVVVNDVQEQTGVDAKGQEVCEAAASLQARAVVMVHYASKGIVQEAVQGSLASYMSRHTTQPLILIEA